MNHVPVRIDPLALAQALMRFRSITPTMTEPHEEENRQVLDHLAGVLRELGFEATVLVSNDPDGPKTANLYARLGSKEPVLAFAGHTDVVTPGDEQRWQILPFEPTVVDGRLFGRGAEDMKSGIAAFVAAVSNVLASHGALPGSLSFVITGDEEGAATNGTKKLLAWMAERDERFDAALVGEPSSDTTTGSTIKTGSRGCLDVAITIHGKQGHTAYPGNALNPIHVLLKVLPQMATADLDNGKETLFEPTNVQVVSIDVDNTAFNVIPNKAEAKANIRFTDLHSPESLEAWVDGLIRATGHKDYELRTSYFNLPYAVEPGSFTDLLASAVKDVTGTDAELTTRGGASDAHALVSVSTAVAELGLPKGTLHQIDENCSVEDLLLLTRIYERVIERFFNL